MSIADITLRAKAHRRIDAGHPWVFSNEIDGRVADLPPGGAVKVRDASGRILGLGYANPASLIAVRLVTRNKAQNIDLPGFWAQRIREAAAHRELVYPGRRSLRLVNAESDGLPGLIIDRFEDVLAVQITTLGMETRKAALEEAIREVLAPEAAILRNDTRMRELEGLPQATETWFGEVPASVVIDELGVRYEVPLAGGQKTGHFFDQAENRRFAGSLCRGRSVLDVYSYSGGWALHALAGGAESAMAVDKSEAACELIAHNAALNGVADRLEPVRGEGRKALIELVGQGARFGAVILDPPAFAKRRKTATAALKGYREINALGMALLDPGGLLFTSSCSYHIEEERFVAAICEAAGELGRRLRLIRRGEQAPDHPVRPEIPETRYLKSYAFEVRPID